MEFIHFHLARVDEIVGFAANGVATSVIGETESSPSSASEEFSAAENGRFNGTLSSETASSVSVCWCSLMLGVRRTASLLRLCPRTSDGLCGGEQCQKLSGFREPVKILASCTKPGTS